MRGKACLGFTSFLNKLQRKQKCTYDGLSFTCTDEARFFVFFHALILIIFEQEQKMLDEKERNDTTRACPRCDLKRRWKKYHPCVKRFQRMKSETSKCEQLKNSDVGGGIVSKLASFMLNFFCKKKKKIFSFWIDATVFYNCV